jgi:hypothetical protein
VHETVGHTPKHTMKRTTYFSEQYKNITPIEREFRRECLTLYNKTPRRKEAMVDDNRKRRGLQADTLNLGSISMEDPTYTHEFVHPTVDPHLLSVTRLSLNSSRHLSCQLQHRLRMSLRPMSTEPLKCKHHVLCGERQAILARRN